ncbi:MAG: hypothetical protein ACLFVS_03200 [Candidatus Acetothermia bacterium]
MKVELLPGGAPAKPRVIAVDEAGVRAKDRASGYAAAAALAAFLIIAVLAALFFPVVDQDPDAPRGAYRPSAAAGERFDTGRGEFQGRGRR